MKHACSKTCASTHPSRSRRARTAERRVSAETMEATSASNGMWLALSLLRVDRICSSLSRRQVFQHEGF